ncbi:MAG: CDP-diacylglycerol--glycerol-3-phosphate 3-phosphatidyltransferase [Streptosporangiaceae bacterium]
MTTDPATAPPRDVSTLNVANILTFVRLLLVPLFAVFLAWNAPPWRLAAVGTFVVAALTDRVDGELARRRGCVTDFGKIADPLADKALIGTALVGLSALEQLAWWVTGVILFRELLITALRFVVRQHGVMPASRGGKAKTLTQIVAIVLYVVPFGGAIAVAAHWVMGLAVVITLASGIDYLFRAWRLRRAAQGTSQGGERPLPKGEGPRGHG